MLRFSQENEFDISKLGLKDLLKIIIRNKHYKKNDFIRFLFYDLIQLTLLLYFTGGISNPFSILLIIPAIVSSTFLSLGTTFILGIFTFIFLMSLSIFHRPLPGIHEQGFTFPKYYLIVGTLESPFL